MTRAQEYAPILMARCIPPALSALEPTEDRVWLSRGCCCERYTLRGVPGALVDVLIDQRLLSGEPLDESRRQISVLEIGRKAGRYDGAERDRLTWRVLREADATTSARRLPPTLIGGHALYLPEVWIQISPPADPVIGGETVVRIVSDLAPSMPIWAAAYRTLRSLALPIQGSRRDRTYGYARIVEWHRSRYYPFLAAEDVLWLADSWSPSEGASLAQANREASRALYRAAREQGWRKLTLRERLRLWGEDGRDRPQWHREAELALLYARGGAGLSATGEGEATLRAACAGGHLDPYEEDMP